MTKNHEILPSITYEDALDVNNANYLVVGEIKQCSSQRLATIPCETTEGTTGIGYFNFFTK